MVSDSEEAERQTDKVAAGSKLRSFLYKQGCALLKLWPWEEEKESTTAATEVKKESRRILSQPFSTFSPFFYTAAYLFLFELVVCSADIHFCHYDYEDDDTYSTYSNTSSRTFGTPS